MWNSHLGYVLTCPSNLGTGLRSGVHVRIPHISKVCLYLQYRVGKNEQTICILQHPKFAEILNKLHLQSRGTGGVDTAAVGGVYDISNSDRLGKSEVSSLSLIKLVSMQLLLLSLRFQQVQLVQNVVDGVKRLVDMEKRLEKGMSIEPLMP